jgi:CDP-diacylglycerol---serine O-phosphatidyltransferase
MMLRQFLNPPNWFSAASLFCGLYAILLAGSAGSDANAFYQAGLMIFYAGLFDALDGRVARLTGTGSAFGVQLDSLIDIISFGVAPACLLYFWGLDGLGPLGLFSAFFLMLCGAFRLARFNVTTDGKVHRYSQGLTITMGGGTVAATVMFSADRGIAETPHPVAVAVFAVTVGLLMVSSIPYRAMKSFRRNARTMAGVLLFFAAFLVLGVMYDISAVLTALGLTYVISGPVEFLFGWPRRKSRGAEDAVHQDDDAPK